MVLASATNGCAASTAQSIRVSWRGNVIHDQAKSPNRPGKGWWTAIQGCCGETGEASVAFFFGEDNLFDLGEILFDAAYPAAEKLSFSLSFTLPMNGGPTFSFGWNYEL